MIIQEKASGMFIIMIISFLIAIGIFFLNGNMNRYHFKVEVKRCNSEKPEVYEFDARGRESKISTYREALPVLEVGDHRIVNVCDYKILEVKDLD